MSRGGQRDILVPLQFLRGAAASAVVCAHLLSRYVRREALPPEFAAFATRLGDNGVFAFFAISGFIMVHVALRGGDGPRERAAGWRFLRDRFTRIAPLYYLTMVLHVAFSHATRALGTNAGYRLPQGWEWVLSFLFVPYRNADGLFQPVYGLGWTLQYEMFFYLLLAIGLPLGIRRGVVPVIAGLVALVVAGRAVADPGHAVGVDVLAYVYTRPILLYFVLGMGFALLRRAMGERVPVAPVPVLSLAALLAFVAAVTVTGAVQMLAIGVALAAVTLVRARGGRTAPFTRVAVAWGDASYAIYLTHSFLLGAFASLTAGLAARGTVPLALCLALACAGCFVAGWLVWRFVERPLTTRLRGRSPSVAASVAP